MTYRLIENIQIKRESRSFIDCLHSVLTAAGLFNGPKYMLSGMTAVAFKFIVNKHLLPGGFEMYSRPLEHWYGVDTLGIYSETYGGFKSNPTFPLYQRHAIDKIRESIDRNVGAIVWAPDFLDYAVVHGYDDSDRVFFYRDRYNSDDQVMLYDNFGMVKIACWNYHLIWKEKVERDIRDIYDESLLNAVFDWETAYKMERETNREFGSGRKAYDYLIDAFRSNDFNDYGACYDINANIISKNEIYMYMKKVAEEIPQLEGALSKYRELDGIYKNISEYIPDAETNSMIDRAALNELVNLFMIAKEVEEAAMGEIKVYHREALRNMFFDLYEVKNL